MRKYILLLTLCSVLLHAQEESASPSSEEITIPMEAGPPSAAIESTQSAKSSEWRNWVFAGSAAAVFTVAVLIVTLNTGTTEHNH